jgi:hypothetical protein
VNFAMWVHPKQAGSAISEQIGSQTKPGDFKADGTKRKA